MILCARSTSRSRLQSAKLRPHSENMGKVCLFYSQNNKSVWEIHEVRKGMWAFFLDCAFRMLIGWARKLWSRGWQSLFVSLLIDCLSVSKSLATVCLSVSLSLSLLSVCLSVCLFVCLYSSSVYLTLSTNFSFRVVSFYQLVRYSGRLRVGIQQEGLQRLRSGCSQPAEHDRVLSVHLVEDNVEDFINNFLLRHLLPDWRNSSHLSRHAVMPTCHWGWIQVGSGQSGRNVDREVRLVQWFSSSPPTTATWIRSWARTRTVID